MNESKDSIFWRFSVFIELKLTKLKLIGNYVDQYTIILFHGYLGREHKDIKRACFIMSYHLTIKD